MTNQIDKLIDELPSWKPIETLTPKANTGYLVFDMDNEWVTEAWVYDMEPDWTCPHAKVKPSKWLPLPTEDTIMMTREELREFAEKVIAATNEPGGWEELREIGKIIKGE